MGSIADKLAYTKRARNEIRAKIVEKGVSCPGNAPFCEFDDYIDRIESGVHAVVIEKVCGSGIELVILLDCTISTTTNERGVTLSINK